MPSRHSKPADPIGFTEFVPLSFVAKEAPMYKQLTHHAELVARSLARKQKRKRAGLSSCNVPITFGCDCLQASMWLAIGTRR